MFRSITSASLHRFIRCNVLLVTATSLCGCATVEFLAPNPAKPKTFKKVGYEYYLPKPFLLVENTKEGHKVSVITLPNLSEKRFVQHRAGWGTTEFGFKTQNGVITEFNNKYDSKGPETITAATGLLTALAAAPATEGSTSIVDTIVQGVLAQAFKDDAAAVEKLWAGTLKANEELEFEFKAIKDAREAIQRARSALSGVSGKEPFKSTDLQLSGQVAILQNFEKIEYSTPVELRTKLTNATKAAGRALRVIKNEKKTLTIIVENPKNYSDSVGHATRAIPDLDKAIKVLTPIAAPTPAPLELYEIVPDESGGSIHFRRVWTVGG